jgi:uncharacterized membrane protein
LYEKPVSVAARAEGISLFFLTLTLFVFLLLLCCFLCFSAVFQLPEGRMLSYFGIVPDGHILDIPNAGLGVLYYSFWLLVMPMLPKQLNFLASSAAMASSVFLACRLVILKELCILCWSTHVINARLWWRAFSMFVANKPMSTQPQQQQGTAGSPLKAKVY